ncbi:hypothetical protein PtB15_15B203 [Puccinia triticina]|nr:hypothetical protein PtB15_15B203 [Puccinia triticina]
MITLDKGSCKHTVFSTAAKFGLSSEALILLLPLETVRKRPQVPITYPLALKARAGIRPHPHHAIFALVHRIISQENPGSWAPLRL